MIGLYHLLSYVIIDASSFININGSVCGPVTLSWGIKHGDSISSQLYIISIEPLLIRLRNEPFFQGITLPLDGTIEITTYADDVNLYVNQSNDINIINNILSTYQSVSNGKVNLSKSCELKMNGWDVGLLVGLFHMGNWNSWLLGASFPGCWTQL